MSPQQNPWVRCPDCHKIHMLAYISSTTVCACGRSLWPVAFPQVRPGGSR